MESALAKARTAVWTSTRTVREQRPCGDNVEDHEGFVLAGCPGAGRRPEQPSTPSDTSGGTRVISSASFRKGLKSHAGCPNTSRKSLTTRPLASLRNKPRECIPHRSTHLPRVRAGLDKGVLHIRRRNSFEDNETNPGLARTARLAKRSLVHPSGPRRMGLMEA